MSYQKHKICYYTVLLRRGTFRVKVPQKRGGSDSPAPLNGLGFHPKTPCNNQIIQTTDYRIFFKQNPKTNRSPKINVYRTGQGQSPCRLWGAVCRWQTFSADRAGRRDRGNRNPHAFPTAFTLKAVPAEQPRNYDNLFLI